MYHYIKKVINIPNKKYRILHDNKKYTYIIMFFVLNSTV